MNWLVEYFGKVIRIVDRLDLASAGGVACRSRTLGTRVFDTSSDYQRRSLFSIILPGIRCTSLGRSDQGAKHLICKQTIQKDSVVRGIIILQPR